MDDYSVSITIMENGLENVAITKNTMSSSISNSSMTNITHNNNNNNNNLSIRNSKKRCKSTPILDMDENYLGIAYGGGMGYDSGTPTGSDTSISPPSPSPPSSLRSSFKARGGT